MDAFEKYYDENVVMQENELTPTIGKVENRKREIDFLSNISEFRGAKVKSIAVGENIAMVECFLATRLRNGDHANIVKSPSSGGRMAK